MAQHPVHPSPTEGFALHAGQGMQEVWLPWHEGGRAAVKASPEARLLAIYAAPGMEQFFLDNGVTAVPGEGPPPLTLPDPEAFAASPARYACEILGPPLTLE